MAEKREATSARVLGGLFLAELGDKYPNIVTMDCDLPSPLGAPFKAKYPGRAFDAGIAEQNAVGVSAGLAHEGFQPFVLSFTPFLSMRACEQVRTDICYGKLPVILIGNGAGYSQGICGATHCGLEDCAIMCSFANMTVLEPSEPWMLPKSIEAAVELKSPVYIRYSSDAALPLYEEGYKYQIGRAIIAREGEDAAIIASGPCVTEAIKASEALKEESGLTVRVVDMHTLKPLDREAVVNAAMTGKVICVQDHTVFGGLGTYVGQIIAESGIGCKYKVLGCPDKFVPLASTRFLYKENEMDAEGIAKNLKKLT